MGQHIFLIAGEASGDALGGPLMEALKRQDPEIRFSGVGGDKMEAAGLKSLLPMQELCVMGIVEVIEHLPRLLKLINWVVEKIETEQPDVLVTIDLPDFNFRVAKLLKKRGVFKGRVIHYVAPTVWAWRPGRAKHVAQFLDGMMCLFPFEPEYFTRHGLKSAYVGHPLTQRDLTALDGVAFKEHHLIGEDVSTLLVMFGSRQGEVLRHGEIFIEAIEYIAEQVPNLELIIPTLPHVEFDVLEMLNATDIPAHVTTDQDDKWNAMAAADAGLVVSGTAALELAYAGVPHVVCYKAGFITWALVKMLVKSRFAHLANILLGRDEAVVPEYLQFNCTGAKVASGVLKLLKDAEAVATQKQAFTEVRQLLATEAPPSELAARFVLKRD
jgi:lipid-A-disaccharide synthase